MKTLIQILKIVTAPIWGPLWLQYVILKKCWRFVSLLLLGSIISGCVSNSARLDQSPCAGCDFQPMNTVPVATYRESTDQQG